MSWWIECRMTKYDGMKYGIGSGGVWIVFSRPSSAHRQKKKDICSLTKEGIRWSKRWQASFVTPFFRGLQHRQPMNFLSSLFFLFFPVL